MHEGLKAMARIPVAGPWITQKEIDAVADAARNGWYANANSYGERFERAFAGYVGTRFAVSLPSCTSALHLALLALRVGPGDEVVVPDVTWIATSAPVSYVGATPVFADIDRRSWCITAESLRHVVTPRTRAVIVVDLYSNMPDMDPIAELARERGIAVIEDAAEAVGSEHRGRRAGSFGDASAFSFHGSKTLTTGEGGMLLTNREEISERALFLRNHAASTERMFWNTEVGFKYRMSALQAALGLAQLERVEELVRKKRQILEWYREELGGIAGLTLNQEVEGTRSAAWMTTVVLDPSFGMEKDELIRLLGERHRFPPFLPPPELPPGLREVRGGPAGPRAEPGRLRDLPLRREPAERAPALEGGRGGGRRGPQVDPEALTRRMEGKGSRTG